MALPGRAKEPRDHQLALGLELARRRHGLTTSDLAAALSCSPRTVRRYLNGERRPKRDTVVDWEQACDAEAGSLTALYDRSAIAAPDHRDTHATNSEHAATAEGGDAPVAGAEPPRRDATRGSSGRFAPLKAAALGVVLVGLVVLALLSLRGRPHAAGALHLPGPSSVTLHRFPPAYTGAVWAQITPQPAHTGQDHLVTLRWGPKIRQIPLKRLGPEPQTLLFRKTGTDDTTLGATVQPPARITFGTNRAPGPGGHALDVNDGWTNSS